MLHVFVFVFMDVLGFALVLPLLPYLVSSLDAAPSLVGTLLTANAAAQLFGAPLLGSLSDSIGRRPVLIFASAATTVSFALLAVATDLRLALASRILDGALGGDVSLAMAYVADTTAQDSLPRALGAVGAAFGLAFILGPMFGGMLVSWSLTAPAVVAAAVAGVNTLGLALFLPESLPALQTPPATATARPDQNQGQGQDERRQDERQDGRPGGVAAVSWRTRLGRWDPVSLLVSAVSVPGVPALLGLRAGYAFMFIAWEAVFASHYQAEYGLDARTTSYILALVALMYAMVQGGAMSALTARVSSGALIVGALAVMGASLAAWSTRLGLTASFGVMAVFGLASGVANTLLNARISSRVPHRVTGSALTLSSAVGSLIRVAAPVAAAAGLQLTQSNHAVILLCAAVGLVSSVAAARTFHHQAQKRD